MATKDEDREPIGRATDEVSNSASDEFEDDDDLEDEDESADDEEAE